MTDVLLTVGTRKGLSTGRRRGGRWEFDGPHFPAQAVYAVGIDPRRATPRLLVGADSAHRGPSVFHSDDGADWPRTSRTCCAYGPRSWGDGRGRVRQ